MKTDANSACAVGGHVTDLVHHEHCYGPEGSSAPPWLRKFAESYEQRHRWPTEDLSVIGWDGRKGLPGINTLGY